MSHHGFLKKWQTYVDKFLVKYTWEWVMFIFIIWSWVEMDKEVCCVFYQGLHGPSLTERPVINCAMVDKWIQPLHGIWNYQNEISGLKGRRQPVRKAKSFIFEFASSIFRAICWIAFRLPRAYWGDFSIKNSFGWAFGIWYVSRGGLPACSGLNAHPSISKIIKFHGQVQSEWKWTVSSK